MQGLSFGSASAARPASPEPEPPLDWTWAYNLALARGDADVTVLIGTHGQIPIKQDGSFMPRTVTWDAARYPGTICGVQSTIFGQANFMADSDAKRVAKLIKQTSKGPLNLSNNAMVDFAERLKTVDKGMSEMEQQGASFLDKLDHRLDLELQTLPVLSARRPGAMKLFRYSAFRYSPDGYDNLSTKHVSLIDKEFLINRDDESKDACKTSHEWHINIFYKDNRGKMRTVDIFPLLVQWATPLSTKRTDMVKMQDSKVTSMQTAVKALHVAGFRNIRICDLTCFVFRPPLDTDDDWVRKDDHFSRILMNMMGRYNFRLVKDGIVRQALPGHIEIGANEVQGFRIFYEQMLEAVRREDSDAVDGSMCAEQRAEIAEAKEEQRRKKLSASARKAARTRKRNAASARASAASAAARESSNDSSESSANSSPEGLKVVSSKRRLRTGKRRVGATAVAFASAATDSSSNSNSDSSLGSGSDSPNDSNSDSSFSKMPGTRTPSGGRSRTRQTLKIQKRRRTNLRRRRRVTKTK